MGSTFITDYGKGTNANEVYQWLCEEARNEHGSSYSGAINMSSGCFAWDNAGPRHPTDADALAHAASDSNRLQKWEAFAYVPVAPKEDFDIKTKTITMNLAGLINERQAYEWQHIREGCIEAAPAGWRYSTHKVTATDTAFGTRRKPGPGSRITKYVLSPHNQEFDSLDAAEQEAAKLIAQQLAHTEKYPQHARPNSIGIEARVRKVDGSPLVTYELYRKKWKVTVEAEYFKAKGPLHTEGFLFFGWAAC